MQDDFFLTSPLLLLRMPLAAPSLAPRDRCLATRRSECVSLRSRCTPSARPRRPPSGTSARAGSRDT
eukprot:7116337-Prymnesium_polylepis.1